MRDAIPGVTLAILFGAMGCGVGATRTIHTQAMRDLACPSNEVKVIPTASVRPDGTSGEYYAEGCKQIRRYAVQCNLFGKCFEPQGVDVLTMVEKQAGFDLRCNRNAIMVSRLNIDTFGVIGCDRQVSYQLLCEFANCYLTQNSQMQSVGDGDPASSQPPGAEPPRASVP